MCTVDPYIKYLNISYTILHETKQIKYDLDLGFGINIVFCFDEVGLQNLAGIELWLSNKLYARFEAFISEAHIQIYLSANYKLFTW